MRVQPSTQRVLPGVNSALSSIELVRNAPALYLLMLALARSGLLQAMAQGARRFGAPSRAGCLLSFVLRSGDRTLQGLALLLADGLVKLFAILASAILR